MIYGYPLWNRVNSSHGRRKFMIRDPLWLVSDRLLRRRLLMAARVRFLDVAKGMSIMLVALGHSDMLAYFGIHELNGMLGTVRMPLFFFLSGTFFNSSKTFFTVLGEKTDQLLKPYFVTLLLFLLVSLLQGDQQIHSRFVGIVYGIGYSIGFPWIPLWYLTHLWLLFLVSWLVLRFTKFQDLEPKLRFALIVLVLLLGLKSLVWIQNTELSIAGTAIRVKGLPFSVDIILISSAFFLLGASLRQQVLNFEPKTTILVLCMLIMVMASIHFSPRLDLNRRLVQQVLVTSVTTFSGLYLALSVAYLINRYHVISKVFSSLGEMSLFVLLFHMIIYTYISEFLKSYGLGGLGAAAALVLCLFLCIVIGWTVRRSRHLSLLYYPLKGNPLLNPAKS